MITAVYFTNGFIKVQPVNPVQNISKLQDRHTGQEEQKQSSGKNFYDTLVTVQQETMKQTSSENYQKSFSYNRNAAEIFWNSLSHMDYRC